MNDLVYRSFFLEPTDTWHRRYEALRACFVKQQAVAEVARRFGGSYGTACNWVSQFRLHCGANQRPPAAPPFYSTRLGTPGNIA